MPNVMCRYYARFSTVLSCLRALSISARILPHSLSPLDLGLRCVFFAAISRAGLQGSLIPGRMDVPAEALARPGESASALCSGKSHVLSTLFSVHNACTIKSQTWESLAMTWPLIATTAVPPLSSLLQPATINEGIHVGMSLSSEPINQPCNSKNHPLQGNYCITDF
jgi:hypothetical protein